MADKALVGMPAVALTADGQKRRDQQMRRNLRIAIRQLERAELYLVALYSLDLDSAAAEASITDIVQRIRALHQAFVERRMPA